MPKKFKKTPSQQDLKELFKYNPETGSFIRFDGYFGQIDRTYWYIVYGNERFQVHRLIWKLWHNEEPDQIDHINGDGLDNRLINLRNVNHITNCRNQKKKKNNTSGFNGVVYHKEADKWMARVKINYKGIHIGLYNTPQEAKEARDEFIKTFYPDHFTERHGI